MTRSACIRVGIVAAGAAVAMVGLAAAPAGATDGERAGSPTLLFEIFGRTPESRDAAYNESLKQSRSPSRSGLGVLQPDGSYQYGGVSVYVKEACPDSATYEPPPLPGRRRAR